MRLVKLAIFVFIVGTVGVMSYTYINGQKAEETVTNYLIEKEHINTDEYYIKYLTDATVDGTFMVKVVSEETDEVRYFSLPDGKVREEVGYEEW